MGKAEHFLSSHSVPFKFKINAVKQQKKATLWKFLRYEKIMEIMIIIIIIIKIMIMESSAFLRVEILIWTCEANPKDENSSFIFACRIKSVSFDHF